jgi:hypothetical protein
LNTPGPTPASQAPVFLYGMAYNKIVIVEMVIDFF